MAKLDLNLARWQRAVVGIVCLPLAVVVLYRALDTGSKWQYLFTILLIVYGIRQLALAIRKNKK